MNRADAINELARLGARDERGNQIPRAYWDGQSENWDFGQTLAYHRAKRNDGGRVSRFDTPTRRTDSIDDEALNREAMKAIRARDGGRHDGGIISSERFDERAPFGSQPGDAELVAHFDRREEVLAARMQAAPLGLEAEQAAADAARQGRRYDNEGDAELAVLEAHFNRTMNGDGR